jgi:transcription termination/antitermination protein NusG
MKMQEPEEQRLEDEQMEPTEDFVDESPEEAVLNDAAASELDEEPASVTQSVDEPEQVSVEEVPDEEPLLDAPLAEEADAELGEKPVPDTPMAEEADEELDEEPVPDTSTAEEIETVLAEGEAELPSEQEDDATAWFVIHCYSGYENKVRHNLEQRIETMGMKDMIFDVVVPTQEEIEVRDGKRRTVERHIFPGYVLVNMILTEESWYVVRNTPGVTGFVGMGNNPTPLRPEEVAQIVKRMEADAPTVKVTFKVGERVRIIDGPFNDFRGVVSEIDMERTKVRVMVSFFGRETPVELDFLQVEKA